MTEEELEKEAIKRVDAFVDNFSQDIRSTLYDRLNQEDVKDFLYGLYIDSAEPREKRIAELEKENAEYKEVFGSCKTCKRTCDMGNCCDPRTKDEYLLDKVKVITERQKLLKENAELEAQIEKMKRCFNCKYHNKFVESKCGECEDYSKWEIKEK